MRSTSRARRSTHSAAIRSGALLACGVAALALWPHAAEAQACSDVTPPVIQVLSPARGSALVSGGAGNQVVVVQIQVNDAESAIERVLVDGIERVSPGGTATQQALNEPTSSRWGLNLVAISATDACGNVADVAHAYLRSGAFSPAATSPDAAARIADGALQHLGQAALDDGNRSDLDDFASIAQAHVAAVNFSAAVPTTVWSIPLPACTCTLRCPFSSVCCIGSVWSGGLRVTRGAIAGAGDIAVTSVVAQPGALDVNASLGPIHVPLTVRNHACVTGNPEFTDYPAAFAMDGATGSTSLQPSVSASQAQFTPISTNVQLTNPRLTTGFSCGIVQFICDFLVDTISPTLETLFEGALVNALENALPTEFEEIADSAGAPAVVASPTRLGVEASVNAPLGSLRSVGGGLAGLQLGLATQVFPSSRAAGIPSTLPGAIRRGGSVPAFLPNPLGIALRDDHVNQALWALWYAGGFDLQDLAADGAAHGLPAQTLSAFALLPPILMPGAFANDVEIGLGDLRIDARLDLAQVLGPPAQGVIDVSALVSARVLGTPSVDAGRQKLGFQATGVLVAVEWITPVDPALRGALSAALAAFVESWLPQQLERTIASIRLPTLGVGATGFELGLGAGTADRPDLDQSRLSGSFVPRPICGDGLLRGGEQCDDGDGGLGDGCDDACRVEPSFTCSGEPSACVFVPDGDADGVADASDNCPFAANATQTDSGGIGVGSAADGIGDACQCGDANDDGFVTGLDGTLITRASLALAPFPNGVGDLPAPHKCDVGGTAGCSGLDATLIKRASLGLPPGTSQVCAAAVP